MDCCAVDGLNFIGGGLNVECVPPRDGARSTRQFFLLGNGQRIERRDRRTEFGVGGTQLADRPQQRVTRG